MKIYKTKEIDEAFSDAIKDAPAYGEVVISIFFKNKNPYRIGIARNESVLLNELKETSN